MTFPIIPASTVSGGYRIPRSLRFRSSASAYLSRTFGTPTDNKKWTFSCWVKRSALCADGNDRVLLSASSGTNVSHIIYNGGADTLRFLDFNGSTYGANLQTTPVYRDCSSWYHVTAVLDTTSATSTITGTSTDRIRFYVNGVQVTSFNASVTVPTQNFTTYLNSAISHTICKDARSAVSSYHDCYLAEVNFIDGQALTPSSFGAFDTNGVWQPKAYTGTYGTNGFYLPFSNTATSSFAGAFNGSNQYLQATLPATLTGAFTVEYFLNRGSSGNQFMFTLGDSSTSSGLEAYIGSTGTVINVLWNGASQITATGTTAVIPVSAWSHFAITRDGSNNIRLFLNGQQVGSTVANANAINNTLRIGVEYYASAISGYLNGSLSNFRVVNGTALYTSNFNVPAAPLTAVSGTSILTLQSSTIVDNSGNSLTITNNNSVTTSAATPWSNYVAGQDSSGAGNNWLSNNINVSSSGTTYDSMIDSPTNYADGGNGRGNYAVLNPLDKGTTYVPTLTNGNIQYTAPNGTQNPARGILGLTSGKWYFEATCTARAYNPGVGVMTISSSLGTGDNFRSLWGTQGAAWYSYTGGTNTLYSNGTSSSYGTGFVANDVIMIAFDVDNGKFYIGKNNSWNDSANPAAGTGNQASFAHTDPITPFFDGTYSGSGDAWAINFGQRPFTYTPPSGFSALNTQNLPTPTITAGNIYFDVTLWTGDGNTSRSLTNTASFQPDFVWAKSRSVNLLSHTLYNSIVGGGANKGLASNTTDTEASFNDDTTYGYLSSFNSDGFSVARGSNGTTSYTNANGATYVGWQWKGGGTGVTNTSGSITSTVSANTSAGFSVATFTVPNSASPQTFGHGLGVTPGMVIIKYRSTTSSWFVYHTSLPSTYVLLLNSTAAQNTAGTYITAVSSSTVSLGSGLVPDATTPTAVAYCFAPVAGYSAFGKYTGNGSADGPFVYTSFRPRWILIKQYTPNARNWVMFDTSRNTYNQTGLLLQPNTSDAELTGSGLYNQLDILSNGFKLRAGTNSEPTNESGCSYIYAAFAENPFKISRAR